MSFVTNIYSGNSLLSIKLSKMKSNFQKIKKGHKNLRKKFINHATYSEKLIAQ